MDERKLGNFVKDGKYYETNKHFDADQMFARQIMHLKNAALNLFVRYLTLILTEIEVSSLLQ